MVGERCNLDKDEAELLKPPSPSSTSPPPTNQNSQTSPPPFLLSPPQDFLAQIPEKSNLNNKSPADLDKDESKLIKPTSPSSISPPQSLLNSQASPSLFLSPALDFFPQISEKSETNNSVAPADKDSEQTKTQSGSINRCSICKRKLGLTGFRCRCGDLFCGKHRYSDTHNCSFDYKSAGREEISRNNPVVRAAKIIKI